MRVLHKKVAWAVSASLCLSERQALMMPRRARGSLLHLFTTGYRTSACCDALHLITTGYPTKVSVDVATVRKSI
jgi:hypothetical protein